MALTRVVLLGDHFVPTIKVYLSHLTPDVMQAYHELMYRVVETIRFRDKAIEEIDQMVLALQYNIKSDIVIKDEIIEMFRGLALWLLQQAKDFRLYDKDGTLKYTYLRHPDPYFDDVMLTSIIYLRFTGQHYEPPTQLL